MANGGGLEKYLSRATIFVYLVFVNLVLSKFVLFLNDARIRISILKFFGGFYYLSVCYTLLHCWRVPLYIAVGIILISNLCKTVCLVPLYDYN